MCGEVPKDLQTKYEPRGRTKYEASKLDVEGLIYIVYIEWDMGGVKGGWTSYGKSLQRVTITL